MLAILDYDAGNIESVRLAFRHVGGNPEIVSDAARADRADRLVFPGVGSAAQCMRNLRARSFDRVLRDAVAAGKPVLAVCIGIQLLFTHSDEDDGVDVLGILPGRAVRFRPDGSFTKVPHMGWNHVTMPRRHPLLPDGLDGGDFYFVHSYYVRPGWNDPAVECDSRRDGEREINPGVVYGVTEYSGVRFCSMAGTGSLFAAQFHPEKSGENGLEMVRRFLDWDGRPC